MAPSMGGDVESDQIYHPLFGCLSDFADRDIGSVWRRRVSDHLADCPACRRRVMFIRTLDGAVARLPVPKPPRALRARILDDHTGIEGPPVARVEAQDIDPRRGVTF